jgi:hypothetical protein
MVRAGSKVAGHGYTSRNKRLTLVWGRRKSFQRGLKLTILNPRNGEWQYAAVPQSGQVFRNYCYL